MAATSGAPVVARTRTTEKNRRDNFDRAVEMGGISLRGGCHPRCLVADYRRSIVFFLRFRDVVGSIVDQSRKKKPRETIEGNLLLLYAQNVTAFRTYFHEHTLTSHRSCVTTLAHTCCRRLPTYASISHPSDSSHICFVFWFYFLLSENGGDERCSSCRAHEARREKSA